MTQMKRDTRRFECKMGTATFEYPDGFGVISKRCRILVVEYAIQLYLDENRKVDKRVQRGYS